MRILIKDHGRESGIALMIVMVVIFVLAALVGKFAYAMNVEMRLARNSDYDSELEWLGRAGVELARYVIIGKNNIPGQQNVDALNQKWAGGTGNPDQQDFLSGISMNDVQLGDGRITVKITDSDRKFNINTVARNPGANLVILQQAMTLMGVDPDTSSGVTDCILDWVDPDDSRRINGAEDDYYLHMPQPYYCKNGPIDDMCELLLVKNIAEHPEVYWGGPATNNQASSYQQRGLNLSGRQEDRSYPFGLHDLFTAFSGGRLNINTANVTALQLVPGIDPGLAENIIQFRAGPDGADGTEDDVPFQNVGELSNIPGVGRGVAVAAFAQFCDVRSSTFEVTVDAEINGYSRHYFALLRRAGQNPGQTANNLQLFKFYWK